MNTSTHPAAAHASAKFAARRLRLRLRLLSSTAAAAVTFGLFQSVALYGKPPASAETLARATPAAAAMTVASTR